MNREMKRLIAWAWLIASLFMQAYFVIVYDIVTCTLVFTAGTLFNIAMWASGRAAEELFKD